MNKNDNNKALDPKDLPQSEVFTKKEVYQHPQPASREQPLSPADPKQKDPTATSSKEEEKTSKGEGLNEEKSQGNAGAFEGFEDQG